MYTIYDPYEVFPFDALCGGDVEDVEYEDLSDELTQPSEPW